jgi:hypothetical protein
MHTGRIKSIKEMKCQHKIGHLHQRRKCTIVSCRKAGTTKKNLKKQCSADIAPFIKAFSESEGLSLEWLEDRGIDGNIVGMCGEMLRDFAKVDVLKIYMPAGVEFEFLTVMKEFALQAFNKASND